MSEQQLDYIHRDIISMRDEIRERFDSIDHKIDRHVSEDAAQFKSIAKSLTEIETRHALGQQSGRAWVSVLALVVSFITAIGTVLAAVFYRVH